jgi:glycosyltransferase involved in cell wall biosynthesis
MPIRVLHIGLDKQWRGGENQIRLLIQNSDAESVNHHVAYPESSQAFERFLEFAPMCPLPSRNGSDPRSIFRIAQYCDKNEIQILHAHSSAAMNLALLVKQWSPKLKLVVHRRVDFYIKKNFFTRRKYMSKKVDHFIAISNCIYERLIKYGISEKKITLAASAIDYVKYDKVDSIAERTKLIKQARLTPDTLLIGMAAAMTGEKGHETLLAACHLLKDEEIPFHCFIAGSGEKEEEIKALSKSLGLNKKISFLGFLPEVSGMLSALDILVVPSHSEGLGTIVLEGIAGGCCVVASRVGGIPEMIIHGETGLLFKKGSAEELYQNIKKLTEEPGLRDRLLKQSSAHVKANFSLDGMVEKTLGVYQKVMGA